MQNTRPWKPSTVVFSFQSMPFKNASYVFDVSKTNSIKNLEGLTWRVLYPGNNLLYIKQITCWIATQKIQNRLNEVQKASVHCKQKSNTKEMQAIYTDWHTIHNIKVGVNYVKHWKILQYRYISYDKHFKF